MHTVHTHTYNTYKTGLRICRALRVREGERERDLHRIYSSMRAAVLFQPDTDVMRGACVRLFVRFGMLFLRFPEVAAACVTHKDSRVFSLTCPEAVYPVTRVTNKEPYWCCESEEYYTCAQLGMMACILLSRVTERLRRVDGMKT